MERTCLSLTVLTLLQLCRAEISDALPENWYSANVINDGFQPKPLSEIFSTESPFSPTNPIIVVPKASSLPDGRVLYSTLAPPPADLTSQDFTKSTFLTSSVTTALPPTYQTPADYSRPSPSPQVELTQYTEQTPPPSPIYVPDLATTLGLQHPRFYTGAPSLQTTLPPSQQANYPQYPPDIPSILQQIQSSTLPPFTYPQTSQAVKFPQSDFHTVPTPSTVFIQPSSNLPTSSRAILSTTPLPLEPHKSSTHLPATAIAPQSRPLSGPYPIRIRVLSPSGSITNVNFNPIASSTTKKPYTTRKPTTTKRPRTQKPKRNTYEACLDGCKVKREAVCAVPLSSDLIDPETLKGFPSVCHMACHNSYKKDHYEKLSDGRCGRLRTRIRTVDSNKIKREELHKSQYIIDNGSKTVVEFEALH